MTEPINADAAKPKTGPSLGEEFLNWWQNQPRKGWFLALLAAWIALFQFLGNSTLGYVNTPSLFAWWNWVFTRGAREDTWWLNKILEADESFAWFVPVIVLGLIWWKRDQLRRLATRVWWPALGLLALAGVLHVLGFVVQQTRISLVAFFLGLWALTGLVWGPAWMRATFFPWFLLFFCVPVSNYIEPVTLPLRTLATKISVGICHGVLGINVIRTGTSVWEPTGKYQYEIAAACSGIRSLTAFTAFTTIFGFVFFRKTWKRVLIIGSSVPLAVISNVIRLLMIIMAAEAMGQSAGNYVHESSWLSLLPYVPPIVGIIFLARWIKEDRDPAPAGPAQASEPALVPLPRTALISLGTGLALVVATGGFIRHYMANQRLGRPGLKVVVAPTYGMEDKVPGKTNALFLVSTNSVHLPEHVLDYRSQEIPVAKVVYEWLPRDTVYGQRAYIATNDNFLVIANVVMMGADRTSIHKPQYCLPAQGQHIVREEADFIRIEKPHPYDLPVMKVLTTGQRRLADGRSVTVNGVFVYWFVADGELTAQHGQRMWWLARDLIRTGVLQRWAYVAYLGYCEPGREMATYERMKKLIGTSVPEFQITTGPRVDGTSPQSSSK